MGEETAREKLASGKLWTDDIARYAFPIVLWCAKNGKKITYGDLEQEMMTRHGIEEQAYKTNYGRPAGKIGHIIEQLSEEWDEDVPPINAIIVNKAKGLPSKGVDCFLKKFLKKTEKKRVTKTNRDDCAAEVMQAVLNYPNWHTVAKHFGYKQLKDVGVVQLTKDSEKIDVPEPPTIKGGGGESKAHRELKEKIANSPGLFIEYGKFPKGKTEGLLRSGDEVDVLFKNKEMILAVEIKANNASDGELVRGIYQCIKYRATIRAMQLADGDLPNAQALLATAIPLKGELKRLADRLKVRWMLVK